MKNDFKDYINFQLIKKGYFNFEEVKAEDLQEVIADYFYNELGIFKSNEDLFTLFMVYSKQTSKDNLQEIISYLLEILSIIQGKGRIEWWQFGQNKEPIISYDIETNDIVSLNTSLDINYEKAFILLVNVIIELKIAKEEERKR